MTPLEKSAAAVLSQIADRLGVKVDAEAAVGLVSQWLTAGIALLDGHAKAQASAAGQTAAAKITTLEEAEESAKKR